MFGAWTKRIAAGAAEFDPLDLPESSISWTWMWDFSSADTLTLGAGPTVDEAENIAGSVDWRLVPYTVAPSYTASWRESRGAVVPAADEAMETALTASPMVGPSSGDPVSGAAAPYTVVYVGQIPTLDLVLGEDYRIPLQGVGTATIGQAGPLYLVRALGTWSLRSFAGAEVTVVADVGSWEGLPFIAIAHIDQANSRWDLYVDGIAPVSVTSLNPGRSGLSGGTGAGVRFGGGGTFDSGASGVFDSPIAFCCGGDGTVSATDRDYLLSGFSARYDIVPA